VLIRDYKVKPEGTHRWVPQFAIPTFDGVLWSDYWENGRRVTFEFEHHANTYIEHRKIVDSKKDSIDLTTPIDTLIHQVNKTLTALTAVGLNSDSALLDVFGVKYRANEFIVEPKEMVPYNQTANILIMCSAVNSVQDIGFWATESFAREYASNLKSIYSSAWTVAQDLPDDSSS